MSELASMVAILVGITARLAIPILVTILAVYFLRRLDAHWQAEGQMLPAKVKKPACWEVMGCSPVQRKTCPGFASALPCWQARRTTSGYLREECLICKVFLKAPVPSTG